MGFEPSTKTLAFCIPKSYSATLAEALATYFNCYKEKKTNTVLSINSVLFYFVTRFNIINV